MERGYWIRSKPVYSTLVWQQQATAHVVLADGEAGALAVIKLFQQMLPEQYIDVFYLNTDAAPSRLQSVLAEIVPDALTVFNDTGLLVEALHAYLQNAKMGLRIYCAGSEKFLWTVADACLPYGVEKDQIIKEQCGTLARSVYCVHCKAITHDIHHNVAVCGGCGRHLFVRDHFSQRMGAYMGLMIDAESPGDIPPQLEVYP